MPQSFAWVGILTAKSDCRPDFRQAASQSPDRSVCLRTVINLREALPLRHTIRPRHKATPWLRTVMSALHDVTSWQLADTRFRTGAAAVGGGLVAAAAAVFLTLTITHNGHHGPVSPQALPQAATGPLEVIPHSWPRPSYGRLAPPHPKRSRPGGTSPVAGAQQRSETDHSSGGTVSGLPGWENMAAHAGVPGWALKLVTGG